MIAVSSANCAVTVFAWFGRSEVYMLKSVGLSTLPWGRPAFILFESEVSFYSCFLGGSLLSCHIVSKAFSMSKEVTGYLLI